jgi:hypothetical protein
MAAYGSSNLDAEAVSRRLYVNVDEGTVAAYDRIFAFNPLQKARIAVNLIHFGRVELAQSLMEAWSPYLAPSPALATSILAAAAEAGDPGLFDACLAYFPQRDNLVLSEACVMEDFSYGFDKVFEPNGDFGPVLEAAVRMSNAAFVERILAVTQRSRLSKDRVAEVLQAAIVAGEARNRYVYLLLLSNGYDPERRYASSVLRAVLLETEAKPDQDLEAKTRFADALLRLGADINRIEPLWGPYLHWYASTDWFPFQYKTGMIKWLLARGANPMARWQGLLYDEIPLSRHGRINEEGVRLRATPDLRGTVIQRLEKGTAFEVLEMGEIELSVDYYTGLWYKIRLKGGVTGWVFGKYIDYEE